MPHCPECGLWVHPADPSCLACEAELAHLEVGDAGAYADSEGLMTDEVTRGRLQTELSLTEFGFAFTMKRGYRPVLIATAMVAFSWLLLPLFALLGYCLTLGNYAARGRDNTPEMVDITSFMGDGLRLFLSVFLVYWLPGVVYLYLANFYLVEPTHIVHIGPYEVLVTVDPVGAIPVYFVGLLLLLLWPAILTMYTGTISLATTYRPGRLKTFIRSRFFGKAAAAVFVLAGLFGFFIALMITAILAIDFYIGIGMSALGLVGGLLAIFPVLAILLTVAIGLMVIFATLGHVYYHAGESVIVPPAE